MDLSNFNTSLVRNMSSMFEGCFSLTSINLSNFNTSQVTDIGLMFSDCWSLKTLNLSSWNTSKVRLMYSVFYNCASLTSLNISNFDTKKNYYLNCMFYNCSSLTSIDVTNFDTSKVIDMNGMFYNCTSLTSLNLSNFVTSLVKKMQFIFYNCTLLTSLNLSNFNVEKVIDLGYVFYNCWSLTSLNVSNWNTISATSMAFMFYNCYSLSSLDLSTFIGNKVNHFECIFYNLVSLEYINIEKLYTDKKIKSHDYQKLFYNVPDNIVVCMNDENYFRETNYIVDGMSYKTCLIRDCSENWKLNTKKMLIENNLIACVDSCEENEYFIYEYNGKCNERCTNGIDDTSTVQKCKCELEQCHSCPLAALRKGLCTNCNDNYYPKENDNLNIGEYINCYKDPEGYYFDETDLLYKKCYHTCKACNKRGNYVTHNCLECDTNYSYGIRDKNNYFNCYEFNCGIFLITQECLENCDINNMVKKLCDLKYKYNLTNENEELSEEEEIEFKDKILENIERVIISNDYNTYNIDNKEDEIIKYKNMQIEITTIENQKNNIQNKIKNRTFIDLGNNEILLRNYYNLSNETKIYLKKIDVFEKGMKIPKIEFDIFYKLDKENLVKLKKPENMIIDLFIPVEITGNIDKLNISSGYFNDICYKATSDIGTDITRNDRKIDYIENNKMICQEDCLFSEYDYVLKRAKCTCKVNETPLSIINMKIDKKRLYENIKDIKNIANINILMCSSKLFSKKGLISNLGFYLLIPMAIFHFISLIIFFKKQQLELKQIIKEIVFALVNYSFVEKQKNLINKKENNKNDKNIIKTTSSINIKNKVNDSLKTNKKKNYKFSKFKKKKNSLPIQINRLNKKNCRNTSTVSKGSNKTLDLLIKSKQKEKIKELMKYTDDEINKLSYDLAIKSDNRTYFQYYISLLKAKHNLIFSFFTKKDYNSRIIKIHLFFISFFIFFTINALFFNDDTLHNIYINEGSFNLEYQLPKIIYSSIISIVLNQLLKFLALSNDDIINLKQYKIKDKIHKKENDLNYKLKVKFVSYFFFSFILLLFCWYYLSMFCTIYENSQYHLIKDTLISFGLSLIYPFIINIFPGCLRFPALKNKRKCLYNLSNILQAF